MKEMQCVPKYCLLMALIFAVCPARVPAQTNSGAAKTGEPARAGERDGQHDFDFDLGSWKIHLSRLEHPLSGSTTWIQFDGTSVTRKVWDGRADLEEFEVDSPTGHIEGLSRFENGKPEQILCYRFAV